jgi:hypothetical protein
MLNRASREGLAAFDLKLVESKVSLKMDELVAALGQLRGAVLLAYPSGLPDNDPIQELLNGTAQDKTALDPNNASIWFFLFVWFLFLICFFWKNNRWAGKELAEGTLSKYLGRNEKTKIVVKLQHKGRGAPARDGLVRFLSFFNNQTPL